MSTESQADRQTIQFLEKLAAFHETLAPHEQAMLDELTVAALSEDDVSGYTFNNLTPLRGGISSGQLPNRPYYDHVGSLLGGGGAGGIGGFTGGV